MLLRWREQSRIVPGCRGWIADLPKKPSERANSMTGTGRISLYRARLTGPRLRSVMQSC